MRGFTLVGAAVVLFAGAGTARAGTLTIVAPTSSAQQRTSLLYEAAPGEVNRVTASVDQLHRTHIRDDGAPVTIASPVGGTVVCTAVDAHEAVCADALAMVSTIYSASPLELRLGDGDDTATATGTGFPTTVHGGDGNDTLTGGNDVYGDAGDDTINDSAHLYGGEGNDTFHVPGYGTIDGGAGNDTVYSSAATPPGAPGYQYDVDFDGGPGADLLVDTGWKKVIGFRGGTGPDTLTPATGDFVIWDYSHDGRTSGVKVTQDGVADDGAPGEGDNVPPEYGDVVGTDFADDISESPLGGSITALGGDDTLHALYPSAFTWFGGNDGNDTIFARDGGRDSTYCADGTDVAIVDAVDTADSSCETRKVG